MKKQRQRPAELPSAASKIWEDFIQRGDKIQRKVLRRLSPLLIAADIPPAALDQGLFRAHVFPHAAGGDPSTEPARRGDVNSFARAFTSIGATLPVPTHALSGIPGPTDLQARAKRAFEDRFSGDLAAYFAARKLEGAARRGDLNGLFNAFNALESSGLTVCSLPDMIFEDNIEAIRDVLGAGARGGAYIQVITVLAHLAQQAGDQECRQDLLDSIRKMRAKSEIGDDQEEDLLPYIGRDGLRKVVGPVIGIASQATTFDVNATRSQANRVSSAICILIMLFAPASFGTVHAARFIGESRATRRGARPTLALPQHGDNIEAPLSDNLRKLIDAFYFRYADAGFPPEGMTVDPDGRLRSRPCAIASIEALLAGEKIALTLLQLRDLGVAQALWKGRKPEDMARAARMGRRAIKARFSKLDETIRRGKKDSDR